MLAEEIILTKLVAGDIINIDFNPDIKDMQIVVDKPEQAEKQALLEAPADPIE